jgi:hypothetical protein
MDSSSSSPSSVVQINNNNNNDNINNINNSTMCSFCGHIGHDIRSCESPEIRTIEQSFAQLYIDNLCESTYLQLNEAQTEEFFVYKMTSRYLLRYIRVVAVTTGLARASGFTKADYATLIYGLYRQVFFNIAFDNNSSESNTNNINSYVRNLIDEFNLAATTVNTNTNTNTNIINDLKSFRFDISLILDTNSDTSSNTICECGICLEQNIEKKNMVNLNCNHSFCGNCVVRVLEMTSPSKIPCCAFCRTNIVNIKTNNSDNYTQLAEFCKEI